MIGAGAAGIAAARRLARRARVSVLVLEARERAGGRAWTVEPAGFPLDLGCEWLHSADRNLLAPLAEQLGFSVHRRPPDWTTRLRRSGETMEAEADWIAEREAHYWAIAPRRAGAGGPRRLASVLVPGGRWNALFDATSTWANAAELDRVSVKDNDRYEDSGVNWRLREGYGRLFEALADGLPVALDAAVSRIDHGGRGIRRRNRRAARSTRGAGHRHRADRDPRRRKRLRLRPAAAGQARGGGRACRSGSPTSCSSRFDGGCRAIEPDSYPGRLDPPARDDELSGAAVGPAGDPLLFRRALRGGARARRRSRQCSPLPPTSWPALFGSDIRRRLRPLAASPGGRPVRARLLFLRAARPCRRPRAVLAAPVDDRLFFAGEACSPNFFSTAHGAYETGLRAADAALASLPIRCTRTTSQSRRKPGPLPHREP